MATQRLFWEDPYMRSWQAQIVARRAAGHEIALDRTAFYPEGGGQPSDLGTINGVAVEDVQSADATIWHRIATPITEDQVTCELDWERRFDHMQQHHGQHLLSAAFEHVYQARTTAFHLGAATTTIDLAIESLSEAQLITVEEWVNNIIWRNLPVEVRYVEGAELAALPLRKPPKVAGLVRVVLVEEIDYSACGGTHPHFTGSVGMIHIRRTEKRGSETRVEFVCGARALRDYRTKDATLSQIAASFSSSVEDTAAAVERLREAESQARKGLEQAQKQLLTQTAAELLHQAESVGDTKLIQHAWDALPLEQVRYVAKYLTDNGAIVALGSAHPKPQLLIAGSHPKLNCGTILRDITSQFNGRGGGSATNAQGGIAESSQLTQALAAALEQIKSTLS